MLRIPEVKFARSERQSNVEVNALCDWLEACAMFDGPEVTKGDVVDILIENHICTDQNQDLAHLIADEGWMSFQNVKGGEVSLLKFRFRRIELPPMAIGVMIQSGRFCLCYLFNAYFLIGPVSVSITLFRAIFSNRLLKLFVPLFCQVG